MGKGISWRRDWGLIKGGVEEKTRDSGATWIFGGEF